MPQLNIKLGWKKIGNRILTESFEGKIHFEDRTQVELPIDYEGNSSRLYQIEYIGPLDRIIVSPSQVELSPGENLIIKVDPQDLLTPGMYARGFVVFHDEMYEHRIEVVLQSELIEGGTFFSEFLDSPSNLISLALSLSGLWFILSMFDSSKKKQKEFIEFEESDVVPDDYFNY